MKAGVIKDIFYRDNNEKYGWVENCEPVYECKPVRFTAGHHQFHTGQILFQIDGRDHGLANDVPVLDGKL